MRVESLLSELTSLLGAGKATAEAEIVSTHSGDKWFAAHPPEVVVFPESTADAAAVLRFADERDIPVTARGAGVGYVGGCVPVRGGIALSLARLNRIKEIDVADGVAVVEPGVVTGDLQAAARRLGWYYPPDPASLKECSIGGNIATNAGGPKCLKYGVTRHYVLGLEVVLADGSIARVGSRCHKNKTGFDLVGLFVGSEGMLGVVTEATLRLIPHPPARAGLTATFADFTHAAAAVQAVFQAGHLPAALEISDRFTIAAARRRLGPDALPDGDVLLMLEVDGRPAAVREESAEIGNLLVSLGALAVVPATDEAAVERLWDQRREFSYSLRDTGLTKLNEDVVVPRGRLVELVTFCDDLQARSGIAIACFGHAGDGNIHVNLMVGDMADPAVSRAADEALDALFRFIIGIGGAITGEHGVGLAKRRWFAEAVGPGAVDLHRRLKRALDPRGVLNPGKFLDKPAGAETPRAGAPSDRH
ncbi:MAG: FAD-binding oxidoreductase [Verrucomicrobiales bacterium]